MNPDHRPAAATSPATARPAAYTRFLKAFRAVDMNLARAVGPAIGGALVAAAGVGWVFALHAVSYLGTAVVLLLWRRTALTIGPPRGRVHDRRARMSAS